MLILVRHAESRGQLENKVCGRIDDALSPKGVDDCIGIVNSKDFKYDAVFSSPMYRCTTTAFAFSVHQNDEHDRFTIKICESLTARSGGEYEGRSYDELKVELAPRYYKLWKRDYFEAPPHGESFKDIADRVKPWIKDILNPLLIENKTVLVVTHNTVMKVILGLIKGMEETEIPNLPDFDNLMPYHYDGVIDLAS